nr:O-antigen ligase family protein [Gaetbulibacter sp. 4G1]
MIFKYFPFLSLGVFYSYAIIGFVYKIRGYGDYLYYSNFSEIVDIHPTYLGLIINFSVWFVIKRKSLYNNIIYYLFLLSFLPLLIMVSSKTSILVYSILLSFTIISSLKNIFFKGLAIIIISCSFLFLVNNFLIDRFLDKKVSEQETLEQHQIVKSLYENDLSARAQLWKSNIESLKGFQILYGNGTQSTNKERNLNYKKNNLTKAYEESYNAHNQFVETLYSYGLVGLILFLSHCIFVFKLTFIYKPLSSNSVIYFCLMLYFMTESILYRTIGIVLYAFIITYIYISSQNKENELL